VSPAFNFGFASTVVLKNNRTNCPFCGQTAHLIDGTFDFMGNAVLVRDAPPQTIAILEILQAALTSAHKGEPNAKVLDKIKGASPELAREIHQATASSGMNLSWAAAAVTGGELLDDNEHVPKLESAS
jgi:hypothetical protein